ncbi:MAG: hypothetical protein ACJAS4_001620 [Bacteriovoracaceae bacterium]|jgi:hypothetical protein
MKTTNDELSQRYLVLIKIDATNLFRRIKDRQHDYLEAFSLKRKREVFVSVFKCRYHHANFFDLSHVPVEIIEVANDFYTSVDELYWYLMNTQDMPNTIEDEIIRFVHLIERKYDSLCLYTDAELSGNKEQGYQSFEDIPAETPESEYFVTDGENLDQDVNPSNYDEITNNSDDS